MIAHDTKLYELEIQVKQLKKRENQAAMREMLTYQIKSKKQVEIENKIENRKRELELT